VLDPTGNRLERTSTLAALPAATYAYGANDRLTSDGWDANGNATTCTVAGANAAFAYDHEDRLVSKDAGTPSEVRLVYDGDGVLVGKTAGGVTTRYLVDDLNPTGLTQVMDETTLAATADVSYTWGSSLLSQSRRSGSTWTTSHYGHDAHGNVTFLADGAGAVTRTATTPGATSSRAPAPRSTRTVTRASAGTRTWGCITYGRGTTSRAGDGS
jgi:YD repeat-containing protein